MFSLRATDERLLRLVGGLLGEHRISTPESGQRHYAFSADCGVERVLPGGREARPVFSLYLLTIEIYRGRRMEEMAGQLVSTLRDIASSPQNEFLRIRAGGVAIGGGALLLPSSPQPHLPALVGLLANGGARFLGDEIIKLDPVLQWAHGMALPLLLDVRDLPLFPGLNRESPTRIRNVPPGQQAPRQAISLAELQVVSSPPVPVRWIVFPHFDPDEKTRLEPIESSAALFAFMRAGLNFHVWGERALLFGKELLHQTGAHRLWVGSIPEAADLLLSSLPTLEAAHD